MRSEAGDHRGLASFKVLACTHLAWFGGLSKMNEPCFLHFLYQRLIALSAALL